MTKATELRELASLTTISSGQIQFDTDIKISGDLITTGNTITITADTLNISDPNITLASGAANSAIADGAGITIDGADATFTWDDATSSMNINKHLNIAGNFDASGWVTSDVDGNTVRSGFFLGHSGHGLYRDSGSNDVRLYTTSGKVIIGTDGSASNAGITVNDSNDVGIGETNPTYKLDVAGQGQFKTVDGPTLTLDSDTVGNPYVMFKGTTSGSYQQMGWVGYQWNTPNYLEVWSQNDGIKLKVGTTSGQGVWIDTSNKVGIGTDAPVHELDVNGAIATRQVRHSIAPTLNLDFANSKQLDPRITFYRDSIATYYDSKGVLRYANVNEPRFDHDPATGESKGLLIEESRQQNTKYSGHISRRDDPNESDFQVSDCYTILNSGVSPDGNFNASRLVFTGSNGFFIHYPYQTVSTLVNTDYTWSVWLKSNTGSDQSVLLMWEGAGSTVSKYVTVTTEWQRFEYTKNSTASPTSMRPSIRGVNLPDILVWGWQVEVGSFPTSYIPSDTRFTSRSSVATYYDENGILKTAANNSSRYGYKWDGRKFVETGLILEGAATNIAYSNFVTQWNQNATTTLGPDNETPAVGRNSGFIALNTYSSAQSTRYTYSIYAKEADANQIRLNVYHGVASSDYGVKFSLSDLYTFDSYGGGYESSSIEDVGNGWRRCSMTWVTPSDASFISLQVHQDVTGSPGTYIWGAQVETGRFATSFIDTSIGSAVTRSADVATSSAYTRAIDDASIQGSHFTDFFNRNEGTFFANYYSGPSTFYQGVASISDGTYNNRITLTNDGTAAGTIDAYFIVSENAVNQAAPLLGNPASNSEHKIIGAYAENDFVGSIDGGAVVTDSSGTIPPAVNQLIIGNDAGKLYPLNKHIKKIAYYDQRLSNAELQALTENN